MRFLDCTDFSHCHSLEELNQMYWGYLERDYQNKKHSSLGMSPRERYMRDYDMLKFPDPDKLEEAFLHSTTRRVNNVACVSVENRIYEVPQKYIGQKIHLRYHPENRDEIYIYDESSGKRLCSAKYLNKSENRLRKREKISAAPRGRINMFKACRSALCKHLGAGEEDHLQRCTGQEDDRQRYLERPVLA